MRLMRRRRQSLSRCEIPCGHYYAIDYRTRPLTMTGTPSKGETRSGAQGFCTPLVVARREIQRSAGRYR